MRPVQQRLAAAGFTPWVVLDQYVRGFSVGLGVVLSSNGNLTYTVQHTFDNILTPTPMGTAGLSRAGTVLTIPITNHGLSANDWVKLAGFGAPFDGEYDVATVPDQNSVTVAVANSGPTSAAFNAGILAIARCLPHSTLAAKTVSADGNYIAPPRATRLRVTAYTAGYVDFSVYQAGR